VPRFEPFPGLRYTLDRSDLAAVTAPPYDVIDAADRAALVAQDPHNVVRIDLPAGEDGRDPYDVAPCLLRDWEAEGVLRRDEQPCLYVYRMRYSLEDGSQRSTLGVVGALELSRPGDGGILPHEQTTPKAKSDRLEMLRVCNANLSSVWGLSPAAGLSDLCTLDTEPTALWHDQDGVEHAFWVLDDPSRIEKICATVASEPVVIADGHHRFETSLAYRDEQREASGGAVGTYDLAMTYVVELVPEQLTVLPIHRLVGGLPDGFDLLAALEPFFEVRPGFAVDAGAVSRLQGKGALCVVQRDGASVLVPRAEAMAGARDLDTSRLDVALAALPPHDLVFQHGVEHVQARVASDEFDAGFLLRPATVEQILDIAHGGERMPPKTTFFHPKPRTGVVIRPL
jgi:uncharacterized protein (DUF1015 family)